jgi:hypothetical protein
VVESYNGTSWTNITDLNSPRIYGGATAGTQTAGLYSGGYTTANTANCRILEWFTLGQK